MRSLLRRQLLKRGGSSGGGSSSSGFYVDSVAGSDSNTGTSEAQAWATLGKLTSAGAFTSGAKIWLKRGSKWREQVSVTATNVEFGNYGTGPLPLIDGSDVAANASFAKTGGLTNVYEISFTHGLGTGGNFTNVWCNGVRLQWVASDAACDAAPGSFTPSTCTANPQLIKVHPPGSTNPISDGKLYEILSRGSQINCILDGLVVRGVWMRRVTSGNGSLSAWNNAIISGCLLEDGNKHNAYWQGGSVVTGNVFWKIENPSGRAISATMGVTYGASGGAGATVEDNYFVNDTKYGLTTGCYSHTTGGANKWTQITYDGNYFKNLTTAMGGLDTITVAADGCFARQCDSLCTLTSGININLANCVHLHDSGGTLSAAAAFGTENVLCNNCRFAIRAQAGGVAAGTVTTKFYNCSLRLHTTASGGNRIFSDSAALATIEDCAGEGYVLAYDLGAGRQPASALRNTYAPTSVGWKVNAVTYSTIATLQAAFPTLETSSIEIADVFTGDPHLNDWTLHGDASIGGRTSGSRTGLSEPDWVALAAQWAQGYTGLNGDVAP